MNPSKTSPQRFIRTLLVGVGTFALTSIMVAAEIGAAAKANPQGAKTYTIRASDKLGVSVFDEDLTRTARVAAKGTLNLPLINEIRVSGLTVDQAQRAIEDAYREGRFLRNPKVTVTIEDYSPREVTIGGQVKSPSRYPLPLESAMTLLELVGKAGGFTDTAKGTAVRVSRVMPDGTLSTKIYDVESILRGKKDARAEDSSLVLEPDDIVYVPERVI